MKCLGEIEASEEKTRCGLKGVDRVGYIKTASLQQHTLIRRRLQLLHPKRDFWCVLRDLMVLVMFVEVVSYVSGLCSSYSSSLCQIGMWGGSRARGQE